MTDEATPRGEDTNFNLLPVLRHFEDKRRYPRIDMHTPVIVTTGEHHVLRARLRNLSAEGLQIRCDPETARTLHPRGTQIVPGTGPEVMVRFDIAIGEHSRPFAGRAQLCYIAAKSSEEIAFGLQFVHLSLDAKKLLADFIMECLRPAS